MGKSQDLLAEERFWLEFGQPFKGLVIAFHAHGYVLPHTSGQYAQIVLRSFLNLAWRFGYGLNLTLRSYIHYRIILRRRHRKHLLLNASCMSNFFREL